MSKIGTLFDRVCFAGGTGVPGIFIERGPGYWNFYEPKDCVRGFQVAGKRVLCNVGAVGYPRDLDWRACYVLFDSKPIWFRRVEYDVETTIRKIQANPTPWSRYGDRLLEGRA
jgi:diadenosine tetraphosphatase ApaH/serine/threonine PP2A family protein phosphatase